MNELPRATYKRTSRKKPPSVADNSILTVAAAMSQRDAKVRSAMLALRLATLNATASASALLEIIGVSAITRARLLKQSARPSTATTLADEINSAAEFLTALQAALETGKRRAKRQKAVGPSSS